jgi:hypothetical protein
MAASPSPNGGNGRDRRGRFAAGNRGGPGNPNGRRAAELRQALYDAADEHFDAIVRKLLDLAEAGERWAVEMIFDRLLGPVEAEVPAPLPAGVTQQCGVFMTMTPAQQARIDELAKIGLAKIATDPDDDLGLEDSP